jgi:hypothetical protein
MSLSSVSPPRHCVCVCVCVCACARARVRMHVCVHTTCHLINPLFPQGRKVGCELNGLIRRENCVGCDQAQWVRGGQRAESSFQTSSHV